MKRHILIRAAIAATAFLLMLPAMFSCTSDKADSEEISGILLTLPEVSEPITYDYQDFALLFFIVGLLSGIAVILFFYAIKASFQDKRNHKKGIYFINFI